MLYAQKCHTLDFSANQLNQVIHANTTVQITKESAIRQLEMLGHSLNRLQLAGLRRIRQQNRQC